MQSAKALSSVKLFVIPYTDSGDIAEQNFPEDGYDTISDFRAFDAGQAWNVRLTQVNKTTGRQKTIARLVKGWESETAPVQASV